MLFRAVPTELVSSSFKAVAAQHPIPMRKCTACVAQADAFLRHVNLTFVSATRATDFAAKRKRVAELTAVATAPPPQRAGCVMLYQNRHCPRSFGNWQHLVVSALLTARVPLPLSLDTLPEKRRTRDGQRSRAADAASAT